VADQNHKVLKRAPIFDLWLRPGSEPAAKTPQRGHGTKAAAAEEEEAMIAHVEVEGELLRLVIPQLTFLWGHSVLRVDHRHWVIDRGPPLLLLRAVDALMSGRAVVCYHRGKEQDGGVCIRSNGATGDS